VDTIWFVCKMLFGLVDLKFSDHFALRTSSITAVMIRAGFRGASHQTLQFLFRAHYRVN